MVKSLNTNRFTILQSRFTLAFPQPPNPSQRIIKLVHDPFFQRNDSVVRDLNLLRTDLGTKFCDIEVADTVGFAQLPYPFFRIARVYLVWTRIILNNRLEISH